MIGTLYVRCRILEHKIVVPKLIMQSKTFHTFDYIDETFIHVWSWETFFSRTLHHSTYPFVKKSSQVTVVKQENFAGAKFRGNVSRLFRRIFFLLNECVMLWSHPYQLMAAPHMQTEEMTLNDEVKKQACATTAYSSFCVEAFTTTKVIKTACHRRRETGWLNRRI